MSSSVRYGMRVLRRSAPVRRVSVLLVGCLVVAAGPLVVEAGTAAAGPNGAPFGTKFDVSIDRGPGTGAHRADHQCRAAGDLCIWWAEQLGPRARPAGSASTYEVGGGPYAVSPGWQCQSQYDVLTCYKSGAFQVGQSLRLEFGMNLCYPSDHAYSIAYTTLDSGDVDLHAQEGHFVGPGSQCTTTHVGYLKVSVTAEVRRIADQYRARVAHARRPEARPRGVAARPAKRSRHGAGGDRAGGTPSWPGLSPRSPRRSPFSSRSASWRKPDRLDRSRDGGTRWLRPRHNRIARQGRRRRAGRQRCSGSFPPGRAGPGPEPARYARTLTDEQDGRSRPDTPNAWMAKLRALDNRLFAGQIAQVRATRAVTLAASSLQRALARRAALDTELFSVAEQLSRMDVVIDHVYVYADGEGDPSSNGGYGPLVFEAAIPTSVLALGRLDDNIARVSAALSDIGAKNNQALQQFLDAERLASDALA